MSPPSASPARRVSDPSQLEETWLYNGRWMVMICDDTFCLNIVKRTLIIMRLDNHTIFVQIISNCIRVPHHRQVNSHNIHGEELDRLPIWEWSSIHWKVWCGILAMFYLLWEGQYTRELDQNDIWCWWLVISCYIPTHRAVAYLFWKAAGAAWVFHDLRCFAGVGLWLGEFYGFLW